MSMRKTPPTLALLTFLVAMLAGQAHASIQFPALEIMTVTGDTGARVSGSTVGSALTMDATALFSLSSTGAILDDFPDTPFALSAARLDARTFGPGTVTVGSLLTATFSSLTITSLPAGASFSADLTYTGGSLASTGGAGRIEGSLFRSSATAPIDASGAFVASSVIAKVGPVSAPVVPVPPAIWMFASGCVALLARARTAQGGLFPRRLPLFHGRVS